MILSIKLVISQIIISKKKNKKIIKIFNNRHNVVLLNILWGAGFIYGYTITQTKTHCLVFLKYGLQERASVFKIIKFTKKKICFQELKNLVKLQPSVFCLLITPKGIMSHTECISLGCEGLLILVTN
jgi:ribosomal protein S8